MPARQAGAERSAGIAPEVCVPQVFLRKNNLRIAGLSLAAPQQLDLGIDLQLLTLGPVGSRQQAIRYVICGRTSDRGLLSFCRRITERFYDTLV